jgi:hypothetical protein
MFYIIETSSLDTLLFRNHVTTEKIPRDNVQRRFLTFFRIFYEPPPFFDLDVDRMSLWLALPFCSRKKYLHKVLRCISPFFFSLQARHQHFNENPTACSAVPQRFRSAQPWPQAANQFFDQHTRVFSNGRGSG